MMIASDIAGTAGIIGIVTAIFAGLAGLATAVGAWTDSRGKADEQWVTLVEKASEMLERRVAEVEAAEAKCQRNIGKLKAALEGAGIPVPPLE